jgi:hypothetical protein
MRMNSGPPLSALITDVIAFFFDGDKRASVAALLLTNCGLGLPLAPSPELVERIRLAILKLANGDFDSVVDHLREAHQDWRDVLVAAGFGDDLDAHVKWAQALSSRS